VVQSLLQDRHQEGERVIMRGETFESQVLPSSSRRREREGKREGVERERGVREDGGAIRVISCADGAEGTVQIESRRGHRQRALSSRVSLAKSK